jgi:hypothetical protein
MFDELDTADPTGDGRLIEALDASHERACRSQHRLLVLIAEADRRAAWRDSGARDLAHWLSMRYGISHWKARRWIAAGHALRGLPRLAGAFARGRLGLDKVVELARFATPEDEADLIRWAEQVSCAAIRHRGDLWAEARRDEVLEAERARALSWWWSDDGRRFGLQAELPAAQGAVVARAIERIADRVPAMPGEEDEHHSEARRADALVALCSPRGTEDADPNRATVVIHARADGLEAGTGGCEIENGPAVHPDAVRRLLCNARVQIVAEDRAGKVVGLGRLSREPSAWMIRQIRYRDRECRFPGCGSRRFTEAHHIVWWRHGGRTDLDNLVLTCSFHHRLVHEHRWSVERDEDGTVRWFDPGGIRHRAGPSGGGSSGPPTSCGLPRGPAGTRRSPSARGAGASPRSGRTSSRRRRAPPSSTAGR